MSSNTIRPLDDDNDDVPTTPEIGEGTNVSPLRELPSPDVNSFIEKKGSTEMEHCNDGETRARGNDPFAFKRIITRLGALNSGCNV
jgi:hypothetical protein